jgi:uncharacterized membrane protein
MEAIGEAWRLLSANRGTWAGMILLEGLVIYALVFAGIGLQIAMAGGVQAMNQARQQSAGETLALFAIQILQLVVQCWLTAGVYRAACKQVRGEPVHVGDLFSATDVIGSSVWGTFLYGLSIFLGVLLCIIPGLLVSGRLMFVLPLIADGRMSGTDAVRTSWGALRGQSWIAFAFTFVASFVAGLGFLLCGVGVLFTAPIYFVATAILYRDFFYAKKTNVGAAWPDSV